MNSPYLMTFNIIAIFIAPVVIVKNNIFRAEKRNFATKHYKISSIYGTD